LKSRKPTTGNNTHAPYVEKSGERLRMKLLQGIVQEEEKNEGEEENKRNHGRELEIKKSIHNKNLKGMNYSQEGGVEAPFPLCSPTITSKTQSTVNGEPSSGR